jgi:hypothetical protein
VFQVALDVLGRDVVQGGVRLVALNPMIGETLQVVNIGLASARGKVLLNLQKGVEIVKGTGEFRGWHRGDGRLL